MSTADKFEARMREKGKLINDRDIKKLQEDNMNKCMHVKLDGCGGKEILYFNPVTTVLSAVIIWAFVIWCIVEPEESNYHLKNVKSWVTDIWTWLYVGTQDVWALFMVWLFFSKYSSMKLGRDDEKPEYSDGTYFTMLFSCGIAIGLFYYGVAEPIYHYKPSGPGYNRYWKIYTDNARAQDAINVTLFHWGIHGWIVYVCIGMLLAFLCYRRGLPMTMRTCFYPILTDKIFGVVGDLIDVLCIICTMFGVCTSLGLGTMQLNAGFHALNTAIPINTTVQLITIWIITVLATLSVMSGIKLGIRRLSEICFAIGCILLMVVLFADKTWYLLNTIVQSTGYYFQWIIQLGFHTDAFAQLGIAPDGREAPNWMDDWTIFYWGWWISWSPFCGMFIAKISRGRTIREFITYTLTLPCAYSFVWFSTFGGIAIRMENRAEKLGMNCSMYDQNITEPGKYRTRQQELFAMFGTTMLSCRASTDMWFDVMRSYGDLDMFMSVIAMIAIILYFITSSDSGSLVIDCLSANGHPEPPMIQRVFWALTEGATATALLVAGGSKALQALQAVSIVCGLPFTFVLNWTCVCMLRALREEAGEIGEDEGRWFHSMFDMDSKKRWLKIIVSIFVPWYTLVQIRVKLDDLESIWYKIMYFIMYAIPFNLWWVLLIASVKVDSISYVGWAMLFFFFAFSGGLRGDIREKYKLDGNMIEDFFSMMLLYPLACMQMYEQVFNAPIPEDVELGQLEMGIGNAIASPDDIELRRSEKV